MLDTVSNVSIIDGAALVFDRTNFALFERRPQSPLQNGNLIQPSKALLSRIPLSWMVNKFPAFNGFFASKAAANAATDKAPTWASCIEYIGRRQPLGARLVALVSVYTTWLVKVALMTSQWTKSTRLAHLVYLVIHGAGSIGFIFLCPLRDLLSK